MTARYEQTDLANDPGGHLVKPGAIGRTVSRSMETTNSPISANELRFLPGLHPAIRISKFDSECNTPARTSDPTAMPFVLQAITG